MEQCKIESTSEPDVTSHKYFEKGGEDNAVIKRCKYRKNEKQETKNLKGRFNMKAIEIMQMFENKNVVNRTEFTFE